MAQTKKRNKDNKFEIDKLVQSVNIQLKKLHVESNDVPSGSIELKKIASYEIAELVDKELIINVKMEIRFDPTSPFSICAEFSIIYKLMDTITKEQVDNNIDNILSPCGSTFSLIFSFLSEKILSIPMIISPNFNYNSTACESQSR